MAIKALDSPQRPRINVCLLQQIKKFENGSKVQIKNKINKDGWARHATIDSGATQIEAETLLEKVEKNTPFFCSDLNFNIFLFQGDSSAMSQMKANFADLNAKNVPFNIPACFCWPIKTKNSHLLILSLRACQKK